MDFNWIAVVEKRKTITNKTKNKFGQRQLHTHKYIYTYVLGASRSLEG